MAQKRVSPWSATQIGAVENVGNRPLIRSQFKEEAKVITEELKTIHHCRKIAHMQVCYPNTITSLSQGKEEPAPVIRQQKPTEKGQSMKALMQSEYYATMNSTIDKEHHMNHRKRAFNREVGRKAILDGVGTLQ
jgi:hypothetical protein